MTTITSVALKINSPAFQSGGTIPARFTCQGESKHPPINIGNLPENARSVAIIVDDPDAGSGTFVHWVAWNIPAEPEITTGSNPGVQGLNGSGRPGYTGPCPPAGTGAHHYHFKVYALDVLLQLPENSGKQGLLDAMDNHVVAEGQLIGLYERM